jgi:hypothetical protein
VPCGTILTAAVAAAAPHPTVARPFRTGRPKLRLHDAGGVPSAEEDIGDFADVGAAAASAAFAGAAAALPPAPACAVFAAAAFGGRPRRFGAAAAAGFGAAAAAAARGFGPGLPRSGVAARAGVAACLGDFDAAAELFTDALAVGAVAEDAGFAAAGFAEAGAGFAGDATGFADAAGAGFAGAATGFGAAAAFAAGSAGRGEAGCGATGADGRMKDGIWNGACEVMRSICCMASCCARTMACTADDQPFSQLVQRSIGFIPYLVRQAERRRTEQPPGPTSVAGSAEGAPIGSMLGPIGAALAAPACRPARLTLRKRVEPFQHDRRPRRRPHQFGSGPA